MRQTHAPRAMLALLFAGLAVSGCTRITDVKGYYADAELVKTVQPGVDNRDSVLKTLGRPSIVSEFDDRVWYYVSQRTATFAFLKPSPTEHNVLVVRFDDKGNVQRVDNLGKDQLVSVDPESDKTPTKGRELSVLQQILGNIGRVGPGVGGGGGPQ
jgi:outer membrane protein assembly factor BamE (lipoprotein component of BamABCDE complex)